MAGDEVVGGRAFPAGGGGEGALAGEAKRESTRLALSRRATDDHQPTERRASFTPSHPFKHTLPLLGPCPPWTTAPSSSRHTVSVQSRSARSRLVRLNSG